MMKRFNFRLQKLLETKRHQEKQKAQDLAAINRLHAEKQEGLKELDDIWNSYRKGILKEEEMTTVNEMMARLRYLNGLNQAIEKQKTELTELKESMELEREHLLALSKEKKIIENLRGRQFERYCQEMNKKEQTALDEVSARLKRNPRERQ